MSKLTAILILFLILTLSLDLEAQVYNMTCPPSPQTKNTCEGSFYDSGGDPSNYLNNQNCVYTFCSTDGDCMRMEFEDFEIQDIDIFGNVYDYLEVFDGPNTASPLLFYLYGGPFPAAFPTTASNGCLTFHFVSDGSIRFPGWHGEIHCMPCPIPVSATHQDCNGGIPLCESQIYQPNPYVGNNGSNIVPPTSCLATGEDNSTWYIFTAQTAGIFSFILSPVINNDDYNFAVYNITNTGCAGIITGASPEISCNYSNNTSTWLGQTGAEPTGPYNGTLNSQGLGGNSFNGGIPVNVNSTYAMVVTNPAPLGGYFLDLEPSTALYEDNSDPVADSIVMVPCPAPTITVYFSEPILCSSIQAADFTVTGGPATTVTSAVGFGCPSSTFTQSVNLNLSSAIAGFNYNLNLIGSSVADLCGNHHSAVFPFTLNPLPNAGADFTVCALTTNLAAAIPNIGNGAWSQVSSSSGGTTVFNDVNNANATITVSQVGVYVYQWTVTNGTCVNFDLVQVTVTTGVSAGNNASLSVCSNGLTQSLFTTLGGTPSIGGAWTGPSLLTGGNAGNFNPAMNLAGLYTYTITGSGGCPNSSATVTVTINPFPNSGGSILLNLCNGSLAVNLFNSLSGSPQNSGTWSGPSALAGGHLGIFTPGLSLPGVYNYNVLGIAPCPSSSSSVTVTISPNPILSLISHD